MGTDRSNDHYVRLAKCMVRMVRDLGFPLKKGMRILDFGCGDGEMVLAFRELGFDAYGIDIVDCPNLDAEHFHKIGFDPYTLPFEDNYFDYVCSSAVFEHVQNTEESFREIYRVMKPGGVATHSLPSRYRVIEPHISVPFGGVIQNSLWFGLWARLGVRNPYQKGLSWKEVRDRNLGYCRDCLNYHSYRDFKKIVMSVFGNIKIVKKEYFKNMPGGAAKLGRMFPIPGYGELYFIFREWELFIKKEKK